MEIFGNIDFSPLSLCMASKLKTVKVSETVHTALKIFVAGNKIKNITSFVDKAIISAIGKSKNKTP